MKKVDWIIVSVLGLIAAVCLYLLGTCGAFPGESARIAVVLKGVEPGAVSASPIFAALAKATGATLFVPWLSGMLSVMALYALVSRFLRFRFDPDSPFIDYADRLSRIGGAVAALVLLFSPALIDSSTRLCAASFDLLLALLTLLAMTAFHASSERSGKWLLLLTSLLTVTGMMESSSFFWLLPFLAGLLYFAARARSGCFPWRELMFYSLSVFMLFLIVAAWCGDGPIVILKRAVNFISLCRGAKGWIFPVLFVAIPVPLLVHLTKRTFGPAIGGSTMYSHIGFTLLLVIALFSPISPYDVMSSAGVVPTFLTAAATFGAGYIAVWWLMNFPIVRYAALGMLGLLFVISSVMTIIKFDPHRGDWADLAAERIFSDLDGRSWLVSDGLLDEHLLLAAAKRGENFHLVSLKHDLDGDYLDRLAREVAASGVGGERNGELVLSLRLGVLPFVRELLALPEAEKTVALMASPDLWYGSAREPVPEFLLVGAGRPCTVADDEYKKVPVAILDSPVMCRRLSLCANNRGVYLEDHQREDDAWKAYRRALTLWPDNISALMNCYGMARAGYPAAKSRLLEYEERLGKLAADKNRRYDVWRLSLICGYIRNPEACVRLGYDWACSGRVGEALAQLTRAIDLAPSARANLLNLMASLYAQERDAKMSREVYRKILAEDAANHDALVGMMRLELAEGNETLAAGYLERAAAVSGGAALGDVERAVAMFVRGDRESAAELLRKATLTEGADARTWSLRAATLLADLEAAKDPKERRRLREKMEIDILKPMADVAVGEDRYYYLVVKGFADMNGDADERRTARDALAKAVTMRPASRDLHEKVIALDISLADAESAAAHSRIALRIDPRLSIANYALGSVALGNGEYDTAEGFLRKAVDTLNPSVYALNDLAEACRHLKKHADSVEFATRAVEAAGEMYEVWDTLASTLLESDGDMERAEKAAVKSVELSKRDGQPDLRSLLTLARVQLKRGKVVEARKIVNRLQSRLDELSKSERSVLEELRKNVR